jgi:hypothetical protein
MGTGDYEPQSFFFGPRSDFGSAGLQACKLGRGAALKGCATAAVPKSPSPQSPLNHMVGCGLQLLTNCRRIESGRSIEWKNPSR